MIAANYHIDPFYSNRALDAKLVGLKITSKIRGFLRSKLVGLKNWIIKGINKDLSKVYIMAEGLNKLVDEFNAEQAKAEYILASKALKKFRKYYTILEDIDFLNSEETKNLSENTLLIFYRIEGKLRSLSLHDETGENDKELKNVATRISINSFHQLHASASI
jgi:hypothetical protein